MKLTHRLPLAAILLLFALATTAQAEQRWLRQPAISPDGTKIAFSHRGQIFTVPVEGGEARAVTAQGHHAHSPVWSPDSASIAFASDVNGQDDIFLATAGDNNLRRLTWTSNRETPSGFSPDGSTVLFSAHGLGDPEGSLQTALTGRPHLYEVDLATDRRRLVLPVEAGQAVWDPEGGRLAYVHDPSLDPVERQHRAESNARQIWLYDPATRQHTRLPETHDAMNPAWGPDGHNLYFLGEASGTLNVWVHDFAGGESRQVTHHEDRPVRFLSASDDGDLVYAQGGMLHLLRAGASEPSPVELDFSERLMAEAERQAVFRTSEFVTSPDGALMAAVVEAEIVLIDRRGNTRQITATSDPEKNVTFSPDGTKLVYAAQRDHVWGIYGIDLQREEFGDELALSFEEVPLVVGEENAFQPDFSPDGGKLGYVHARREIRVLDLDSGEIHMPFSPGDYLTSYQDGDIWFSWSPDSRNLLVSWKTVPFAVATKAGIVPADASAPIRSITSSVPSVQQAWFSSDGTQILVKTPLYGLRTADQDAQYADLYRIFMSDEARADFLATADGVPLPGAEYDFQDERNSYLEGRLTGESAAHIMTYPVPESPHMLTLAVDMGGSGSIFVVDLQSGEMQRILSLDDLPVQAVSYVPARNAVDLVLPDGILTVSLEDTDQRQFVPVSLELMVDHRGRRHAAFEQIWADLKFKYYRADIEGRDWDMIGDHYRRYLGSIASDREFSELIAEMFGEISGSHLFVSYSPPEPGSNLGTRTASLGVFRDNDYQGPGVRIAAILPGGPLDREGLGVEPGDVVLSVEGRLIPDVGGIDRALDGMADRPVKIGVVSSDEAERLITVQPVSLAAERALDLQRWIDTRRELVAERSRECIVYAYLRGMDNDGYLTAYGRLLAARDTAVAALVDVRTNHGGNLHRQLLTLLSGRAYAQVGREDRAWATEPLNQWVAPSAVLIDSYAYSDGSIFPQAYQDLGLGPVVGDRLMNTGTGVNYIPSLLIRGLSYGIPVQPFRRMDGSYYENGEIMPDIEIRYDPNAAQDGRDLKLEAAVDALSETLGHDRDCR